MTKQHPIDRVRCGYGDGPAVKYWILFDKFKVIKTYIIIAKIADLHVSYEHAILGDKIWDSYLIDPSPLNDLSNIS